MCGRYTLTASGEALAKAFDLPSAPDLPPRFNIAPTQEVAAVRVERPATERRLVLLRWGLIPWWAEDPTIGNRMINARAETVAEKPTFRDAFRSRRCLVVADGFYEWKRLSDGTKQPFYVRLKSGELFAFAGLWDSWRSDGADVESCTLLTTDANELVRPIHDRMPVILKPRDYDLWLNPEVSDPERLTPVLGAYDASAMEARPVSRYVNDPANDSPRCIEAVA